jgi:hypothetical protein
MSSLRRQLRRSNGPSPTVSSTSAMIAPAVITEDNIIRPPT